MTAAQAWRLPVCHCIPPGYSLKGKVRCLQAGILQYPSLRTSGHKGAPNRQREKTLPEAIYGLRKRNPKNGMEARNKISKICLFVPETLNKDQRSRMIKDLSQEKQE